MRKAGLDGGRFRDGRRDVPGSGRAKPRPGEFWTSRERGPEPQVSELAARGGPSRLLMARALPFVTGIITVMRKRNASSS